MRAVDSASLSSPSTSASSWLHRLPAVILPHVCSYLSPEELLVTVARTATSVRDILSPACFSSRYFMLGSRQLSLLSSVSPPWPVVQSSFPCRVLSDCRVCVDLLRARDGYKLSCLEAALDHFPVCGSLSVYGFMFHVPDYALHSLLQHPAAVSCSELALIGLMRKGEEPWAATDRQPDERVGTKRKAERTWTNVTYHQQRFDWTNISLPFLTRLRLRLYGFPIHAGGAAFLAAHTALLELDVSTLVVSVDELVQVFEDTTALPQLTRFGLHEHAPIRLGVGRLTALVTALATTVMAVSGRPRPMEGLLLNLPAAIDVLFTAAALMPDLCRVELNKTSPRWMNTWVGSGAMLDAFPQLQELALHVEQLEQAEYAAATDMLPFLQSISSRPLQRLSIHVGERVAFNAAAMAELAHCQQLRELDISVGIDDESVWMDWCDVALFDSFAPRSLCCLRSVKLEHVRLSAEAVAVIASAARQLHVFSVRSVDLSCHPAVVCAIVGGYCEDIAEVSVVDHHCYAWCQVQAVDVSAAYQSAVAAAEHGDRYRPFTRLRRLQASMCWCTSPSAWHALLSLLKWAVQLNTVGLSSSDPLVVCALAYLPSLTALGPDCGWPASFATFLEMPDQQTHSYRYLEAQRLQSVAVMSNTVLEQEQMLFELADAAIPNESNPGQLPVRLRPHSDLLPTYQRSLSAEQQAVLARWASGDFHANDGQVKAAEGPMKWERTDNEPPSRQTLCPPPDMMHSCFRCEHEPFGELNEFAR